MGGGSDGRFHADELLEAPSVQLGAGERRHPQEAREGRQPPDDPLGPDFLLLDVGFDTTKIEETERTNVSRWASRSVSRRDHLLERDRDEREDPTARLWLDGDGPRSALESGDRWQKK